MTQKEKIYLLKDTIVQLYEKEGRSKVYIAKLLKLNRKDLSNIINKEWKLIQGENKTNHITPRNQKFINQNRQFIENEIQSGHPLRQIADKLKITCDRLTYLIKRDTGLHSFYEKYLLEQKNQKKIKEEQHNNKLKELFTIEDLPNEKWRDILGYPGYMISNLGRVKSKNNSYNNYRLLTPTKNVRSGRLYVSIKNKNLQVSRLVGFAFLKDSYKEGYTIEHIDNDITNNHVDNLKWVSQSENNQLAYEKGRCVNIGVKYKKIILNNKYEFKTIAALAKFLDKSETQVRRYINKECAFDGTIEIIR